MTAFSPIDTAPITVPCVCGKKTQGPILHIVAISMPKTRKLSIEKLRAINPSPTDCDLYAKRKSRTGKKRGESIYSHKRQFQAKGLPLNNSRWRNKSRRSVLHKPISDKSITAKPLLNSLNSEREVHY